MARNVVWGIDIGQTALRGVKAVRAGDRIQVLAFDSVEYRDILSAPDVDRDSAIQDALRGFLARNRVGSGDTVLASIPGQSALIRFIKLPPVEQKRIPDIVRYEAHQQIPFPLEEVVWDYKPLEKGYGPGEQVEVGIFAMRRDIVQGFLSNLMVCNLEADALQLAPMALYNYVRFDRPGGAEAQVVIDMGAENTEMLICTATSVWPRSLPISGNDFTEAIMEKFKVPFEKAETLKKMAKQSKYSKQIYQAMEPKLRRLSEEIQRSVGFYRSTNPGVRMGGILALGGSFKLPGLAKYLSENLHLPISSLTDAQNFDMGAARNPRVFQENGLSFGVALGLAVQGCGLGDMDISLLPQELLQRKIIARKKPWAAAVAACAVLMLGTAYYSTGLRRKHLNDPEFKAAQAVEAEARQQKKELARLMDVSQYKQEVDEIQDVFQGRDVWIPTLRKIFEPVPANNPEGPWLQRMVSARVKYDDVVTVMAAATGRKEDDPLEKLMVNIELKPTGMEFDQSVSSAFSTGARQFTGWQGAQESSPSTQPRRGARAAQEPEEPKRRRDIIYVMITGETTNEDRALYINRVYRDELANTWVLPALDQEGENPTGKMEIAKDENGQPITYKGFFPPAQAPGDDETQKKLATLMKKMPEDRKLEEFQLAEGEVLFAAARVVSQVKTERFVNYLGEPVELEGQLRDQWNVINANREEEGGRVEVGPGETRQPTRAEFLTRLAAQENIQLRNYTEFGLALLVDPNGTLYEDVQKRRKELGGAEGGGSPRRVGSR